MGPQIEQHWENLHKQISDEKELYHAQVNDIIRIQRENQHVLTVAKQLVPFVMTIVGVKEMLSPLASNKLGLNDSLSSEIQIYKGKLDSDSKKRFVNDEMSKAEPSGCEIIKKELKSLHITKETSANHMKELQDSLKKLESRDDSRREILKEVKSTQVTSK